MRYQLEAAVLLVDDETGLAPEIEKELENVARTLVGRLGLKQAQDLLRGAMHREAMARTGGSRRAAASLLQVDRRYVQLLAGASAQDMEKGR